MKTFIMACVFSVWSAVPVSAWTVHGLVAKGLNGARKGVVAAVTRCPAKAAVKGVSAGAKAIAKGAVSVVKHL